MTNNTLLKIAEFASLDSGWCYGEGIPAQRDVQDQARELFYVLFSNGIEKTDAFPGVKGEIRITGYKNEHYLEFTIEQFDCVTFLYESNDEEIAYQENLTLSAATQKAIETIAAISPCQSLSDQYTLSIGINKRSDFKAWHLSHQVTAAFQYFAEIVQWTPVDASANTQKAITRTSQTTRQSTGHSTHPYSQAITHSSKNRATPGMAAIAI